MHLLFDLDGTLTDSREGITRCFQHALAELGYPVPTDRDVAPFIGPPLAAGFACLLGTSDAALIDAGIAAFRRRFEPVGMFENRVYPGIADALDECAAMGCTLSVVTGKPHIFAQRILDHFELTRMFHGIHGSALADRQFTKTRLIHDACATVPELACATLMIGDRADDVQSAKEARVHSLAVTWGYAGENELTTALPDYMVDSPAQLVDCVRSLMGGAV